MAPLYQQGQPEKVFLSEQLLHGLSLSTMSDRSRTLSPRYSLPCVILTCRERLQSTLEIAIRREDAPLLELLLQYQADPQLREPGQELPIIVAASSGTLNCVQILLAYGADPRATEHLPSAEHPGQMFSIVRRKTAIDVASPFPAIVAALQMAISAGNARASPAVKTTDANDTSQH